MYDMVRASRDTRWKYIRHSAPNRPYVGWNSYRNNHPIMQEMWRLHVAGELDGPAAAFMASTRPAEELYDTDADPWEIENVAADPGQPRDSSNAIAPPSTSGNTMSVISGW